MLRVGILSSSCTSSWSSAGLQCVCGCESGLCLSYVLTGMITSVAMANHAMCSCNCAAVRTVAVFACSTSLDNRASSKAQSTHLGGGVTTLTSNKPGFLAFLSGLLRRGSCDLPPLLLLPGLSLLLARATVWSLCEALVQLQQLLLLLLLLALLAGMCGCIGLTGPHRHTDCICTRGVVVAVVGVAEQHCFKVPRSGLTAW